MSTKLQHVHVFTNAQSSLFRKEFPGFDPVLDGFRFTYGLEVPEDVDVLIVYTRASYSIPTKLPRERTVFFAAEPDVIHPYSSGFLNQFGLVMSGTNKPLKTEQFRHSCCALWFAGIDFAKHQGDSLDGLRGIDWFRALEVPQKSEKISIVTSSKVFTPYHRKRLEFIEALQTIIPDRIEMFGRGFRSVDDKADALLPYAYHLAVENGAGPDLWTEKLADPYLCWAFPFYAGCDNVADYFPVDSLQYVDLDNPVKAAREMVTAMENGRWKQALPAIGQARDLLFTRYNAAALFARLARMALAKPVAHWPERPRLIRSERSLWPEAGAKGSVAEWALRNAMLAVSPHAELRAARIQTWLEARRAKRRKRKLALAEMKTKAS